MLLVDVCEMLSFTKKIVIEDMTDKLNVGRKETTNIRHTLQSVEK